MWNRTLSGRENLAYQEVITGKIKECQEFVGGHYERLKVEGAYFIKRIHQKEFEFYSNLDQLAPEFKRLLSKVYSIEEIPNESAY